MDWTERDISLDGPAAAVISAGMKAVARADGDVHPRELELIAAFEADLPDVGRPDPRLALATTDLRDAYVRSLILVALADGVISEEEERVIGELCSALGVEQHTIDQVTLEVKQWFLSRFSGVTVFKDAVDAIAQDLGVSAE